MSNLGGIRVLLSGGLDSTALLHFAKAQGVFVDALFIDYGQAAAVFERRAATLISARYGVLLTEITFNVSKQFGTGEIVGRNLFLVSAALISSSYSQGLIAIGLHSGTHYFDCSPAFVQSVNTLLAEHSNGKIQLLVPFLTWVKRDIALYCKEHGVQTDGTYSCEAGVDPSCGKCLSCLDRRNI